MSGWDYNVVFGSIIVLLALIVGFVLFLFWLLDRFLRNVFAKKQNKDRDEREKEERQNLGVIGVGFWLLLGALGVRRMPHDL